MDANQNAIVVIGDSISTSSLNSANVNKMTGISKAAGLSLSGILDRAIGQWLGTEAPVYLDHATRNA